MVVVMFDCDFIFSVILMSICFLVDNFAVKYAVCKVVLCVIVFLMYGLKLSSEEK